MLPKRVIAKLERIDTLIPGVNAGGCGYIAYALYKYLKKHYPELKPSIIYIVDNNDKLLLQHRVPVSCYHAVVKVVNTYYDSTGEHTIEEGFNAIKVAPKLARKSLDKGEWNTRFDVNNVKYINKVLGTKIRYKHNI